MPRPSDHLPSLHALLGCDEGLLDSELRLVAARRQIAIVRTLADQLERCVHDGGDGAALQEQLVEELARLGCRSLEAASTMTAEPSKDDERSGVQVVDLRRMTPC